MDDLLVHTRKTNVEGTFIRKRGKNKTKKARNDDIKYHPWRVLLPFEGEKKKKKRKRKEKSTY